MTWEDILYSYGYNHDQIIEKLKQAEREGKVCLIPELTDGEKRMIGTDVEVCSSRQCVNCAKGCVRKLIYLKKRSR